MENATSTGLTMAGVYDDVKTLMAAVGEKIGQGAEFGWDVVVRQQLAEGVARFVYAIGFLVVSLFMVSLSAKLWKKNAEPDRHYDGYDIGGTISGVAATVFLAVALGMIASGVMHLINPEFYAIQFFVDLVKPAASN